MIPRVSIIIVTYNRWDLLRDCLDAIERQNFREVEVIVVDNGSDAETARGCQRRPIRYLKPTTNLGFAGGNNLGAQAAKGEYLFLLNNDAFLGTRTLQQLITYADAHPSVTIAQPTILIHGSDRSNGAGSYLTQWGFLWHRGLRAAPSALPTKPDPIFSALGAGTLVRREAVSRHGLFDQSFFAYFEETDFCWRIWTRGGNVAYVPTDPMTHIGGQTAQAFNEKLVIFTAYRNRLVSFWRHLELPNLLLVLTLHHVAILGVAVALLPKRPQASVWILAVILWELTHPLTLLKTRAQHMRRRTIRDLTLWPLVYRPQSLRSMIRYLG